jgi:hypothetical protein
VRDRAVDDVPAERAQAFRESEARREHVAAVRIAGVHMTHCASLARRAVDEGSETTPTAKWVGPPGLWQADLTHGVDSVTQGEIIADVGHGKSHTVCAVQKYFEVVHKLHPEHLSPWEAGSFRHVAAVR